MSYWEIISNSYAGYANWFWHELSHPHWKNSIYWLLGLSLFFFSLELIRPWRKKQPTFRKDFWLDFFYMFFNFFIFSLIIYNAVWDVFVHAFDDFLGLFGIENWVAFQIDQLPIWAYFLILFVIADFLQWNIHRLLHRVPWLWEFHKVHHSVEQMGFAAHLRYHWMETVVYKTLQFIPLTMLGYNLVDLFALHIFTVAVGHFNHSNITVRGWIKGAVFGAVLGLGLASLYFSAATSLLAFMGLGALVGGATLGPIMGYLFNSPEMHIWHHVHDLPDGHPYGINYGITLAVWDYLWGTNYLPESGRDIKLGFPGIQKFPKTFWGQIVYGFRREKSNSEEGPVAKRNVDK